ncbi:retrovirus-related Pol polyprotein from transposon 412 [Trichonephila clavipes]|nr:retrovirus-related Pol polyprotein from transposon 412 [Trichonephila clavipes]
MLCMSQILQTLSFLTGLSKGAWFHSRLQQERITFHTRRSHYIFKIKHRTESIRQVTANENITIPPRTEIIVPGYIGNDVSFNSGLIGSAENKANGLLIASTLVDLSRKTIPVRICNVTEKSRVFQKGEVLATCSPVTCLQKFELAPIQLASTVDSRSSRKC